MSSRFDVRTTPIAGLHVIHRHPVADHRGFLERVFCSDDLKSLTGDRHIKQINLTHTVRRGTTRGMHFQHPPCAEMKFMTCIRGRIFDVAVDLRRKSQTFLRWHGEVLSDDSHSALVVPEGFAHGFQALTDDCEVLYLVTAAYDPASEGGLHPNDPKLAIRWPEPTTELSVRDAAHPLLGDDFEGIVS